jgi:UMF1 family MFS transporter
MQAIDIIKDKKVLGFSLYDFSNSAYILIFNAYLFPVFFKEEIFKHSQSGDYYWGISVSASILIASIISPVIGHFADKNFRKNYLLISILAVFTGIFLLSVMNPLNNALFLGCFIFTNISYVVSLSLYDSILPHITTKENVSVVSSFAWGMGYLGGIICFVCILILQHVFNLSTQHCFLFTGIFYLFFSLFALTLLPSAQVNTTLDSKFKLSTTKLFSKNIVVLLVSFWLINDATDTIINFASLYGRETLNIDVTKIGIALLVVQFLAFPATILMGFWAKRVGEKSIIIASLVVWLFISGSLILSTNMVLMMIIVFLTSFVIGTTSSLMRSYYSKFFERENSSFSFGIYSIITRASALLGPLVFGFISSKTQNQQIAMISIFVPLMCGGVLFSCLSKNIIRKSKN